MATSTTAQLVGGTVARPVSRIGHADQMATGRRVEVPCAGDPARLVRVAPPVLELSEQLGYGAPLGEEYAVTGWQAEVADRAQDFEGGTIYLDTATSKAGCARWHAYDPLTP